MPATPYADLPVYSERARTYQEPEVLPRVRAWASSDGSGDKDKIDWNRYRKAFLWYDASAPEDFGSYRIKIGDVINGTLYAIWRGVTVAAGVMQGSRGGTTIPNADRTDVRRQIERYYAKARDRFNDKSIQVPWA